MAVSNQIYIIGCLNAMELVVSGAAVHRSHSEQEILILFVGVFINTGQRSPTPTVVQNNLYRHRRNIKASALKEGK